MTWPLLTLAGTPTASYGMRSRPALGLRDRPVLTRREATVAILLGEGRTNGQIAESLYISAETVRSHVSAILRKLDCANRTEVAAIVNRAGVAR